MTEHKQTHISEGKRLWIGSALCIAGALLNLLLFLLKYSGGTLISSVAVTADGFNNLTDTGSCLLTLFGFLIGCKKPDAKYPMGYGRWEYITGLLISSAVVLIGARMLFSSFGKILHPTPTAFDPAVILILLISISVKGAMYLYQRFFGRLLQSAAIRSAAADSLSDCFATLAILAASLIERCCGFHADGYTGILVAFCILYAGFRSVRESIRPLLGRKMDEATEQKLRSILQAHPQIRAVGVPLLHDYGPDQKLLIFSVSADEPLILIPLLEKTIREQLHMEAFISPLPHKDDHTQFNAHILSADTFPLLPKNSAQENKPPQNCPKYSRTKETQECETYEHQTR